MHVPLDDVLLARLHVYALEIACQKYSATLTGCHRLHDERLRLLLCELVFEVTLLVRQDPRLREEIIFIIERFLHAFEIPAQIILMGQTLHARIVINSLIRLHFLNPEGLNTRVRPVQVPVRILVIVQLVVQFSASLLDHAVLRLSCAQD